MISFKQFIAEDNSFSEVKKLIDQYSPGYFGRTNDQYILRKMRFSPGEGKEITVNIDGEDVTAHIFDVHKDRRPKDSPLNLHVFAGQYFEDKFGFNFRSGAVFGAGDVSEYSGWEYAIFPLGKWSYVWSPEVDDLFVKFFRYYKQTEYYKPGGSEDFDISGFRRRVSKKVVWATLDLMKYTNNNLPAAIRSGHEIMIDCDKFLAIPKDKLPDAIVVARS